MGEPPPSRLRRRTLTRSHAARLGGHARRDHRSMDAPPGPSDISRVGHRPLLDVPRRHRSRAVRSRSRGSTPPTAACSIRSRRNSPAPTTAATRSCSSRSSRRTIHSTPGSDARSSARSTTARASTTTRSSSGATSMRAREGAAGSWRNALIRAPYTRDAIVGLGMISETFETACTWDRFEALHENVTTAVLDTAEAAGALAGRHHLPVHARVPRRTGAVLHGARRRSRRPAARAMGGDQGRRRRRPHPQRRIDHAPPRRRPRSPARLRPPTAGTVRRRTARGASGRSTPRESSTPEC